MDEKIIYKAVHSKGDMPAHIQRQTKDGAGRRVTNIIAICDSTGLDNNKMVDFIASALYLYTEED